MKIVCLGDSITRAHGLDISKSWVELANKKLNAEVLNYGISGDTSTGMLVRFHTEVLKEKPDAVFIMGGGNDLRAGCFATTIQANILAMVKNASERGITPILGLTIPQDRANIAPNFKAVPQYEYTEEERAKYRNWLIAYAKAVEIPTIDFFNVFDGVDNFSDLYIDGLHVTEEAQHYLAEHFCKEITKILKI